MEVGEEISRICAFNPDSILIGVAKVEIFLSKISRHFFDKNRVDSFEKFANIY